MRAQLGIRCRAGSGHRVQAHQGFRVLQARRAVWVFWAGQGLATEAQESGFGYKATPPPEAARERRDTARQKSQLILTCAEQLRHEVSHVLGLIVIHKA